LYQYTWISCILYEDKVYPSMFECSQGWGRFFPDAAVDMRGNKAKPTFGYRI
jgi:hypothetical protein